MRSVHLHSPAASMHRRLWLCPILSYIFFIHKSTFVWLIALLHTFYGTEKSSKEGHTGFIQARSYFCHFNHAFCWYEYTVLTKLCAEIWEATQKTDFLYIEGYSTYNTPAAEPQGINMIQ